ncbi:MAG: hypothetical protein K1562_03370 [Candidatus Thiodiazotropha sp. (ex. Lucinisca nassula)]|nr:hypothetical protein [Candidatus Thiodiazotropha sp. (ex. Lucinisca nassula)]
MALNQFVWLIPLLPLLAAAWIGAGYVAGWNRGESGERQTALVASGAALLSMLLILALDILAMVNGAPGQLDFGTWLASGDYNVQLSFSLDALGLSMATLVVFLCFISLRFSVNYLHREAGFQRFFMVMSLFTAAMLLIVTAGNAVLTFVGWELAGVSSYLLIAYAYDRPTATENATRAFVTNRIGDAGFILGIYLSFTWLGSVEWPMLNRGVDSIETLSVGLLAFGFLIAAAAKSALVPFSTWISRALEGPTSSSAVFYGAVMVHAGVYLVIRMAPVFEHNPMLMTALVALGVLTALYGFLGGLVQTDVKSALMFAVTTQIGLMFLWCGLGWSEFAAWHLAAHALWRGYQFLSAPAHMHMMKRPNRPLRGWLARQRWLYTAALQRFWLDHLADSLLVKPSKQMSKDMQNFDERIVNRFIGLPGSASAVSSLAQWESRRLGDALVEGDTGDIGHGRGFMGRMMEWLASLFGWFEEHLVLRGGGEGLLAVIQHLGKYVQHIEDLLVQPRYLLLMIMATFVVIL